MYLIGDKYKGFCYLRYSKYGTTTDLEPKDQRNNGPSLKALATERWRSIKEGVRGSRADFDSTHLIAYISLNQQDI